MIVNVWNKRECTAVNQMTIDWLNYVKYLLLVTTALLIEKKSRFLRFKPG
jgi:hypothetical protein